MKTILTVLILVVLGALLLKLLSRPMNTLLKFLIHAATGFLTLLLFNFLGKYIGVSLPITWLTSIVAGAFGLPGVAVMLILRWLL